MGILFGVFALFGDGAAHHLIETFFGSFSPKKPDSDDLSRQVDETAVRKVEE